MATTAGEIREKTVDLLAPGAPCELRAVEIDGVTMPAYKNAQHNLIELLQAGRAHGDIDFIVYEGQHLSYTEFYHRVDMLAAALQKNYGVKHGDRVAIAMRNAPEWAIAMVAASLIGAIVVPLNSWGKADELIYGLTDCGACILVCDAQRFVLLASMLDQIPAQCIVAHSDQLPQHQKLATFEHVLASGAGSSYQLTKVAPGDIAMIVYTSGSTGLPKGVACRHINICQALMNMFFIGFLSISLEGARELRGGALRETLLLTVPLFHCTGLISGLLLPLQMGQKVVMLYKWDPLRAMQLIETEKVTSLTSVPAVLQALLTHPDYDNYNTSSLFRVSAAGAASPTGLPDLIEARIGNASRSTGWGMTETMAVGSTMSGVIYDLSPASAGIKSPVMALRFVDTEGRVVPLGDPGEIQCRGATVCAGYWNKPDADAELFVDGWMKTGDIGLLDSDGFLHITGRIKEIILRGGENIYPGEIEAAAYALDSVQENIVFGVPDAAMGEELAIVVYPRPYGDLTEDCLRGHLSQLLASYKVPRYIQIVDQPLPQNASGKLLKRKIQEEFITRIA